MQAPLQPTHLAGKGRLVLLLRLDAKFAQVVVILDELLKLILLVFGQGNGLLVPHVFHHFLLERRHVILVDLHV